MFQKCWFSFNRKRLFSMMNDLPTLFEVVTGRKSVKDEPTADSGSKSRNSTKVEMNIFFFLGHMAEQKIVNSNWFFLFSFFQAIVYFIQFLCL